MKIVYRSCDCHDALMFLIENLDFSTHISPFMIVRSDNKLCRMMHNTESINSKTLYSVSGHI